MKTKNIILPLLCLVILSCNSNSVDSNFEQKLSQNDIIIDSNGDNKIESNLKMQLKEYLIAFNGGDPDVAISYCYPDMFVILKQRFPEEFTIGGVKEMMRKTVRETKESAKKVNATFDLEIGDITNRVDLGSEKLYSVLFSLNTKKGLDEMKMGEEIIAISNNYGENWKFLSKDPELAPDILKMKFSEETVNKIMEK